MLFEGIGILGIWVWAREGLLRIRPYHFLFLFSFFNQILLAKNENNLKYGRHQ
jgi:hypothetical protein